MHIKNIQGEESRLIAYLGLCDFYAFYAFCAFLCAKQKRQHFYACKKHLRGKKWLVWRFALIMLFMRIKNI